MKQRLAVGVTAMCITPLRLERAMLRLSQVLGVDSLFIPDHYCGFMPRALWRPEVIPAARQIPSPHAFLDPFVMLGMIAATYRRVRIATGVTEALRRHPVSLAQAALTIDHISKGRFILGIGNGERENTEPYGVPFTKRVARLEEALAIIRLLWESRGEPVDFDGTFWSLRKALFATPLYNGKAPPIWLAANAPRMLQLTGRYADGWLPNRRFSAQEYRSGLDQITMAAAAAGRSMAAFEPALMIGVTLDRDRRTALANLVKMPSSAVLAMQLPGAVWATHGLRHPMGERFEGFADFLPEQVTLGQVDAAHRQLTPELLEEGCLAGNLDEVTAAVRALVDAGLCHLVLWNFGPPSGAVAAALVRLAQLLRRLKRIALPPRDSDPSPSTGEPAPGGPARLGGRAIGPLRDNRGKEKGTCR